MVVVEEDGVEIDDVAVSNPRSIAVKQQEFPDAFAQKINTSSVVKGVNATLRKRISRGTMVGHTGIGEAKSKKEEVQEVTGYNLFEVAAPPYNLDYLAQLTTVSEAHASAIAAKVSNVVGLGYDFINSHKTQALLEKTDSEEKKAKVQRKLRDAKNTLSDWIDSLNSDDEFLEVLKKVYTDYEATGNGYFEIGRTANGAIGYIGHIPATSMRVRIARDGYVQVISNKAVYFKPFGTDFENPITNDTEPNEVIHIKKYNPINGFYGIPDVISALSAIAGNEFATRFNLDYFENKAVPRYVIVLKGAKFSASAESKVINFFEANLKGVAGNHRTLFIPLPADSNDRKTEFKMEPVEAGTQEASFVNFHNLNRDNILMAHRVFINKVALPSGTNLAAARDADKTFKEQVCRPEQHILNKKLGRVFKMMTDMFDFKLNELTLTDEDTQSQIDERYLRMQTIVPNEVRARWGMTGIKNGDKPVELKPQQAADQRATGNQSRARDSQRSASAPDKQGEARNPKGEGRQVS